jgi:hypothetical protein
MSTLPDGPKRAFTVQEVDAWLLAAQERRAHLHLQAAHPWHHAQRQEAFKEMSRLLQEAFEEVRVVSEALRECSQGTRSTSAALQAHSTQLIAQCAKTMARTAQFASPSPEALHEAESRLLALFKGEAVQRKA